MRRLKESEITNEFERQYGWGDDERYLYNSNRKKASVMGYQTRLDEVLRLVEKYSPGKRVADLASAQGNFGLLLAERGFDVTAVDIKREFLEYARKKHTHGKFETIEANLIDFRDSKGGFDCVLAGEIIEHVAFPEKLLQSVMANLKPGGIVILTTPNGGEYNSKLPTYSEVTNIEELIPKQFHWGDHLFLYTDQELRMLFSRVGLSVLFLEKFNSQYFTQLKGVRYLLPLSLLKWFERKSRRWTKKNKDSTNLIIVVGQKPQTAV
jgi:2-polyprenyl-3-methyl-5-hydroxy-6-metoxy-1,4-benzoquinol methylase